MPHRCFMRNKTVESNKITIPYRIRLLQRSTLDNISHKVFAPGNINKLTIRNRIIRSGCFEGLCFDARPSPALIEHHRRIAAGGIGMTTVAYCAVSRDGIAFSHEMWMREEIIPALKQLTDAVHHHNAAAAIQLGHCGFFSNKAVTGNTPLGPSRKFCLFRFSACRAMNERDIERVRNDFGLAARLAVRAGFDAIEIHAGHGYLLSQFLSPWTNKRRDTYGGSLTHRLAFPLSVIRHIRENVGPDFPIIVKMNCEDGFSGGLTIENAIEVARAYEQAGVDLLVPSCGFTARNSFYMLRGALPVREYLRSEKSLYRKIGMAFFGRFIIGETPYQDLFLFNLAQRIKNAVKIPVAYLGGVCSLAAMDRVMAAGFEFVQVGRATIKDPDFPLKMQSGDLSHVDCDHCNRCVAAMAGNGVTCPANKSTTNRR